MKAVLMFVFVCVSVWTHAQCFQNVDESDLPNYLKTDTMKANEYTRIIPRDLFNESKLLKCIGQLCLLIHDGMTPIEMNFHHDGEPFIICQNPNDGNLYISNISIWINKTQVDFSAKYNSKAAYTLWASLPFGDYEVFTDSGKFHKDFDTLCTILKNPK